MRVTRKRAGSTNATASSFQRRNARKLAPMVRYSQWNSLSQARTRQTPADAGTLARLAGDDPAQGSPGAGTSSIPFGGTLRLHVCRAARGDALGRQMSLECASLSDCFIFGHCGTGCREPRKLDAADRVLKYRGSLGVFFRHTKLSRDSQFSTPCFDEADEPRRRYLIAAGAAAPDASSPKTCYDEMMQRYRRHHGQSDPTGKCQRLLRKIRAFIVPSKGDEIHCHLGRGSRDTTHR